MQRVLIVVAAVCLHTGILVAQAPDLNDPAVSAVVPRDQEVTLRYENRPIVVLRARVLNRLPADRAESASRQIRDLVSRGAFGPVTTREFLGARVVSVGSQDVLAVVPADLDLLSGEALDSVAIAAAQRLEVAMGEAREMRSARAIVEGLLAVAAATAIIVGLFWVMLRIGRLATARLLQSARQRLTATWRLVRVVNLPRIAVLIVKLGELATGTLLLYWWLSFSLRQFPYTRPWGESLRSLLLGQVSAAAQAVSIALPGLITVAAIALVTRAVTKVVRLIFDAVEAGRITLPGVYPDTAVAARRLVTALLWLLATAMAYPNVPGSDSSAFKGLSVFVGVVVSIGSSGVMQHLMSGLMLTFSRAVHVGDFARIGDVTGTVTEIGPLATKVRSPYGEEITIPNAVVVSQNTTNYSKVPGLTVPLLTTSVTIGYDTPWRQVEGLLLAAALDTPGVLSEPKPFVWRAGLEDFYVKYTLLVAPADPTHRAALLDQLHIRILDAFNQYGVQIMSPHYVIDPHEQKVVPPTRWHQAPASTSGAAVAGAGLAPEPRRS